MTAASMVAMMRRDIGLRGRPNKVTRWYAERNGNAFLNAPWCDMHITMAAVLSGNYDAVCFGTDYAYTVWHAQRFERAGRWHRGSAGARPGDIVFFQWEGGTPSLGKIDHVGVVEKNLGGGRLQTIEGNTGDACLRRVRSGSIITGYGRPDYSSSGGGIISEGEEMLGLKKGDKGAAVKLAQLKLKSLGGEIAKALIYPGGPKDGVDSEYGDRMAESLRLARKSVGSKALAGYGDTMTPDAVEQLDRAVILAQLKKEGGGSATLPDEVTVTGKLKVQK